MGSGTHDTVTAINAPALFLTATGSLLISTSNRIGRIVDRIRALVILCERGELEQLDSVAANWRFLCNQGCVRFAKKLAKKRAPHQRVQYSVAPLECWRT